MNSGAASISVSQPGPNNQPRYPGNGEGDDSDQQIFSEPRQSDHFAQGEFIKRARREDPPSMQADWQPKRAGLKPRVGQDPPDQEQGGESGGDQDRIGELDERVR